MITRRIRKLQRVLVEQIMLAYISYKNYTEEITDGSRMQTWMTSYSSVDLCLTDICVDYDLANPGSWPCLSI